MATPLIVIVGPTASGKSSLALELAERYNGEIICADSRTVYKGMDIGTAKPSKEDQAKVPHHLLDIRNPDEPYNVADFQKDSLRIIEEIQNRGRLPIMVGGTGLYVDSILFGYGFSPNAVRDEQNPRHLKKGSTEQSRTDLRPNTLIIGLDIPKEILEKRIHKRIKAMLDQSLEAETKQLAEEFSWEVKPMTGVGYLEWREYFTGHQELEETVDLIATHTRQYAKRQRMWFKRNSYINWVSSNEAAQQKVMNFLQQNK